MICMYMYVYVPVFITFVIMYMYLKLSIPEYKFMCVIRGAILFVHGRAVISELNLLWTCWETIKQIGKRDVFELFCSI